MLAAIWLGLAIAALGALDVGNVYFVRRQLQRTADLAAMAAVQMVSTPGACASATSAAQQNATANGFSASADNTSFLNATCGRWDTSTSTYFSTSGNPLNAVQVQVGQRVPFLFIGPARDITATATALASNIDAFSLGTGIAGIDTQQSALLNAILGGLLKTNVSLSVGDVQSLASARIKLDDLRVALGAATMKELLGTTVTFDKLMTASVDALKAGGDSVNANILNALAVVVPGSQSITVGDGGTAAPGLLALGLANPESAASATVDAFDVLMAAAQIAQSVPPNADGTPSKTPPAINVTAGLKGVAGITLQVVNPPVLAVGEGGTLSDGTTPRTIARTAVLNLNISLQAISLPRITVGAPPLLSVSLSALSTPLVVQVAAAPGTASLTSVDCESSKAATQATISVTPGIASVCVAGDTGCSASVGVAKVWAQVLGVKKVVAGVTLGPLGPLKLSPGTTTPVVFNGASGSFDSSQSANSNPVGSDASVLTATLFNSLSGAVHVPVLGIIDLGDLIRPIIDAVTTELTKLLSPVFDLLDAIVVPVLSLLGVQIGTTTLHNMSLKCGVPQLVK